MAGTVDNPNTETSEAPPETLAAPNGAPPLAPAPDVIVPDDASRLCVNCAALLAEGQDWCLECGTAQPGRISERPGWRAALIVVGVVALLAAGAVAAAYAALSKDAEHEASAPPPASAQPVVPTPPAASTPAPAETTPSVPAPSNDVDTPKPSKAPKSTPAPAAPPSSGSSSSDTDDSVDSGSSAGSTDTGSGTTDSGATTDSEDEGTAADVKPFNPVIGLSPDAASTFDPMDRSGGLTGDPADAIDGRLKTAWEAPAGEDGKVNIGLLVSLDKAKDIDKIRLQAGTPGFTVEVYGSKLGSAPEQAPGATKYWTKLDTTRDFGTDEKLTVGGTYHHVLVWFTDQPADTKVMIPELSLLRKKP
jgi:outer membrane biosynthesis protein TonB